MSNIRRQSIISSLIVYFGFALGLLNTYFFTREGNFTPEQYGLISAFIAIANIMFAFANLGMQPVIYKFYPYYKDNLPNNRNDLLTWALLINIIGFILVVIAGILLKDFVIRKYGTNAPDLIRYYYWLFPFGLGLTIFMLLESYAWQEKKAVLTNFLKEAQLRIFTTVLIVLFLEGVISSFDGFIKIYAFIYLLLAAILFAYLLATKRVFFVFQISRVTRKFYKKIAALAAFMWSGNLIFHVANVFDTLIIAAVVKPNGLAYAGIYSLAQNIASLIQAPQRGVVSAAIQPLSRAWKDKDYEKIKRIYHRSAINQLMFAAALFTLIYMNFTDGIMTFSLKDSYLHALPAFIFIGLWRIMDMGTGVNSQIIGTSVYWRFELLTGIILLTLTLPLNYWLTKSFGITGTAVANLLAFSVYNLIRCLFLWTKLKMQPFHINMLYILLLSFGAYAVCYLLFGKTHGIWAIAGRSAVFTGLFTAGVIYFKLTPDVLPAINGIRNKLGMGKRR